MHRLSIGKEEFTTLFVKEDSLQDRFESLITTFKLMGYKLNSFRRLTTMWEKIIVNFIGDAYEVRMEVKTYGYELDCVRFEIFYMNKVVKMFVYDRKEKKVESLYEMMGDVLIYV